jgi:hypothetical protein
MTRAEALGCIINRHVSDARYLAELLERGGQARLASALRERLAAEAAVGGSPRPDAALWLRGQL